MRKTIMRRTRSQSLGTGLLAIGLINVKKMFVVAGATVALVAGIASMVPSAYATGRIPGDGEDKFIAIGMGLRQSFNAREDGAANGSAYSNEFKIDNARIYINGGIHKYVKFAFNTECFNCNVGGGGSQFAGSANIGLLDAIGQFEFNEQVNFWVGRTLIPTDRGELNGPYYHAVFDGFRTPLGPSDFSGNFAGGVVGGAGGTGPNVAGLYGRDNGAVFFGKVHPGGTHLQYIASVFQGLRSNLGFGPNQGNSLKYAGRLTWNLLNDESNPGYYTSGTYYGTAGDILAIAAGGEHQKDGAGSFLNQSDFTSFISDILFEKVLPNKSVLTVNAEYKRYWAQNLAAWNQNVGANADCFCLFSGTSFTAYALYLFPNEIGIGRFQPYGRYTFVNSVHANALEEYELGMNYVISGHNARFSTYWRNGTLATNRGFLGPNPLAATGQREDSFHVALQLQY